MKENLDEFTKRRLTREGIAFDLDHATEMIFAITSLAKTMTGKKRDSEIYKMHRENLKNMSDNQLKAVSNSGRETDWKRSPLYYAALIDEMAGRKIIG